MHNMHFWKLFPIYVLLSFLLLFKCSIISLFAVAHTEIYSITMFGSALKKKNKLNAKMHHHWWASMGKDLNLNYIVKYREISLVLTNILVWTPLAKAWRWWPFVCMKKVTHSTWTKWSLDISSCTAGSRFYFILFHLFILIVWFRLCSALCVCTQSNYNYNNSYSETESMPATHQNACIVIISMLPCC